MRHEFPQVARNIRIARKASGHTQESLARALDITMRAVQGWELGESLPARQNLVSLAEELKREPAWFYGISNEREEQAA